MVRGARCGVQGCTMHDAPCSMHLARCTLHLCTLHDAPCTLHLAPCTARFLTNDVSKPDSQAVGVLGVARVRAAAAARRRGRRGHHASRRPSSACSGPAHWNVAYVQPSRRPADGRFGENPNRLFKHHQFQVILKPAPDEVQQLYLDSLEACGINPRQHDIRFEEDNWESPTLGAWGIGWQVMFDGMEISQFTYFQQAGGIELAPISAELTYGLERIAMVAAARRQHVRHRVGAGREVPRRAAARGDRAVEVRVRPGDDPGRRVRRLPSRSVRPVLSADDRAARGAA